MVLDDELMQRTLPVIQQFHATKRRDRAEVFLSLNEPEDCLQRSMQTHRGADGWDE